MALDRVTPLSMRIWPAFCPMLPTQITHNHDTVSALTSSKHDKVQLCQQGYAFAVL